MPYEEFSMAAYTTDGRLSRYDWVLSPAVDQRAPEEFPYSYSPHYLFRKGRKGSMGIKGTTSVYTDRMREQDPAKARRALEGFHFGRPPANIQESCQKAAEIFWGLGVECVGYAIGCNQSNGYPYGIFFLKEPLSQED